MRFVAWQQGSSQEARAAGRVLTVPLPVPYPLPPAKYQAGDIPWSTDLPHAGLDSRGCTASDPRKAHYGLLESREWEEWEFVASLAAADSEPGAPGPLRQWQRVGG